MPGEQDVPKLTNDRHGHENTEIDNAANPGAAGEAESSPGTSPTTSTATTGIHFDHLGARMMAVAQCAIQRRQLSDQKFLLFDVRFGGTRKYQRGRAVEGV